MMGMVTHTLGDTVSQGKVHSRDWACHHQLLTYGIYIELMVLQP